MSRFERLRLPNLDEGRGPIEHALKFIELMTDVEERHDYSDGGSQVLIGRKLAPDEVATKRAALELLRNYFNGEMEIQVRTVMPRGDDRDDRDEPGHAVPRTPAPVG